MKQLVFVPAGLLVLFALLLAGCVGRMTAKNPPPEDTPAAEVEHEHDGALVSVEHPEQFPVATASRHAVMAVFRSSRAPVRSNRVASALPRLDSYGARLG